MQSTFEPNICRHSFSVAYWEFDIQLLTFATQVQFFIINNCGIKFFKKIPEIALYAVGQFSEHLQPDINRYADDILPVLFVYLANTCQTLASGQKVPRSIDRVFYALETFCETMESKMEPYVPTLMDQLFAALNPSYPFHVKELALSAIGATGTCN